MVNFIKRIPKWFFVFMLIGICIFMASMYGRYTIVHEREPAWSPDGRYIAFACKPFNKLDQLPVGFDDVIYYEDVNGICLKDMVTGKTSWVTRSLGMRVPTWSPDGSKLAWISGFGKLVIKDLKTNEASSYSLKNVCDLDCLPSFSQDGQQVFLQSAGDWLDLSTQEIKYSDKNFSFVQVFSPTGQFMAYSKNTVNEVGFNHLVVENIETKQVVFESRMANVVIGEDLQWNPEGSILAWVSVSQDHNVQLGLTRIKTGEVTYLQINDIGWPEGNAWSPNGDNFILVDWSQRDWPVITVIKISCEENPFRCEFALQKSYELKHTDPSRYTWSPDGKRIAYQTANRRGEIWIVDLETGQDYPLIEKNK